MDGIGYVVRYVGMNITPLLALFAFAILILALLLAGWCGGGSYIRCFSVMVGCWRCQAAVMPDCCRCICFFHFYLFFLFSWCCFTWHKMNYSREQQNCQGAVSWRGVLHSCCVLMFEVSARAVWILFLLLLALVVVVFIVVCYFLGFLVCYQQKSNRWQATDIRNKKGCSQVW